MMPAPGPIDAEAILTELAGIFLQDQSSDRPLEPAASRPTLEDRYRALVEQIPAVVFMAYLDQGIGEAYVSPQIERALGFSQREWLEDPVRWYQQIHPDDKDRWSVEAAQMFLTGQPLKSAYRVLSRDGRVIWFHCEAKMIRRTDGSPWFIHGVGFDITELKQTEAALAEERDMLSGILGTVGALVAVLDPEGRIVQFNRACEEVTGFASSEAKGRPLSDFFPVSDEARRFQAQFERWMHGARIHTYTALVSRRDGEPRLVNWSVTILRGEKRAVRYVIAAGMDVTEHKQLEMAVLEVSNSEQRRIGQDLHDGLGQHLTGIAFMSKALEQKLADKKLPEAADASKIVRLVNEGINKTRQLARGLLPTLTDSLGLMSALQSWAGEVEDLFRVACRFECPEPVMMKNESTVNHLYRITQESVHNAIRHGKAKNILIRLSETDPGRGELRILDDGSGFVEPESSSGMGLNIMRYRASIIGGELDVRRAGEQGTLVICNFPK